MSYVRMGENGSDVYVYPTGGGESTCCWCRLGPDFNAKTPNEMLAHVEAHRAAGHHVPTYVDDRLKN